MENISAVSIGKYYGRYYDGFNQKKYEALLKQYGLIKLLILFLLAYKLRKNITIAINPLTKESFKLPPKNKVNEDAAST